MADVLLKTAAPYLIQQDMNSYTDEDRSVWKELVHRRMADLQEWACHEYLDGYQVIGLRDDEIPNLTEIARRLEPRTRWATTPVSGFLPHGAFFEMLAARKFPTSTKLRSRESLDYTPEPDIFHDVFGHVPMHAHKVFADFLQHYGAVCATVTDMDVLEKLGRLFWFTVEFGVIRQDNKIKIYGSGVISSHGECHSVLEGGCQIHDFNLEEVLATPVKVDEIQKILFAIESFDQIYEAMHQAEKIFQVSQPVA